LSDVVARLSNALADRYRVECELGAGGMATVYLAHDLKHDRQVAVKVLRPELAAVIGAERFLAEIKTTANLQHPHILPLHDSGEADGFLFYVMPYVEGESLRARIAREHQLPVGDAVRIAREVASALDYAHRHSVIHRDIKPENILLHDGSALVADFGIALAVSSAGTRMTETGMSLGTPHYMSPEQAMGEREITARSDVYALGCVTYEMLVGEPPFTGPTAQAIIARVVTEEPRSLVPQRKSIPPYVEAAVRTALEKLPADRFASAAEFAAAIEGRGDTRMSPVMRAPAVAHRDKWRRIALAATLVAVGSLAVAGWARHTGGAPPEAAPVVFAFGGSTSENSSEFVAISRDGRKVVESWMDSTGISHLVVRDLGVMAPTVIPGTDGGKQAEFSDDGTWVAYVADGKLMKVPTAGGPTTVLADSAFAPPAWGPDGSIFYSVLGGGLWRIPPAGGSPERLTVLDSTRREFAHWYPQVLPGGHVVLFNNFSTPIARSRIEALDLRSGRRTVLVDGAVHPRYVASGHLLYARDGAVFAVPFDPVKLKVLGTAVPVLEDVAWAATDGAAGYAVSDNGTLVYLKASEWNVGRRLVWMDRQGRERPAVPDSGQWADPRRSPDGRWIAAARHDATTQIWLYDLNRQVLSQLTHTQGISFNPLWTPDSRFIVYSGETPVYDLHRISIDGTTTDTLVATASDKLASSISPDGRTIVYQERQDHDHLMLLTEGKPPVRVDRSAAAQRNGAFSPDGRWLAFEEVNAAGESNVYVRSLAGGGRRQVSAGRGTEPRWTRGGREIVYRTPEAILAASFDPVSGEAGTPAVVLRTRASGSSGLSRRVGYDVTQDGSEFLLALPLEHRGAQSTVVVLNWLDELRRKVPR
jgi:hypothetical protein